jgi:Tfp pilus assembly protein PilF
VATGSCQCALPYSTITRGDVNIQEDFPMTANNSAQDFFTTGMQEFAKNRFNESIELLTHAIEADPDHTLAIVSRGAAYLKLDMLDQARDEFNRAIGIDPGYARAYHMRGLVGEKRGTTTPPWPISIGRSN